MDQDSDRNDFRKISPRRKAGDGGGHWSSVVVAAGSIAALCWSAIGCHTHGNLKETIGNRTEPVDQIMQWVDAGAPRESPPVVSNAPLTLRNTADFEKIDYWNLSLAETIEVAISNGEVLRDLGATVLRAPRMMTTDQMQALAETDPQFGMEAALSAFDAQFTALGRFQNNDRKFTTVSSAVVPTLSNKTRMITWHS